MRGFAVLAALMFAGCVQKASSTGSVDQADSQYAGKALAASVEDSAGGYGAVNVNAVDATCVTATGDTADSDGDTVPNAATLNFNCTSTSLGFTGTLTGTIEVTDTQPTAIAWAFTGQANLHALLIAPNQDSITSDRTGSLTATQASVTGPFALDRALDVSTTFHTARAQITVDETTNWTMTYTPQAAWTPGGLAVSGSLAVTGSWTVSVGRHSADATLATPTPLTLDPSCQTRVTAGTVVASYMGSGGHQATISVTWSGCGASTVTYSAQ